MIRPLAAAAFAALVVSGIPADRASARPFWRVLLGDSPDSTNRSHAVAAGLDSVDVQREADRGYISIEELAGQLAGADVARVGMDGVVLPMDLTGAGRGRVTLQFDDIPAGDGLVHWDNYAWVPIRGLESLVADRGAFGGNGLVEPPGAGGRLTARSSTPGIQPLSTVALTGGSFGHRLAEMDFARTFGKFGFHADAADLTHGGFVEGFGGFGPASRTRGFVRLTFPLLGYRTALSAALSSGRVSNPGVDDDGLEKTGERHLWATFERGGGRRFSRLTLLNGSSRLETAGSGSSRAFHLRDSRWRAAFQARRPAGSRGEWGLDLAFVRETRTGVLSEDNAFLGGGGVLSFANYAGSWNYGARFGVRGQEPTGLALEPAIHLRRETGRSRAWFEAGRTTGTPGIILHQDRAQPDGDGMAVILEGLENLEKPESHLRVEGGISLGGSRLGAGAVAGATRTSDSPGYLSPSRGGLAFQPIDVPFTSGHAGLAAWWIPRHDLEFEIRGGWHEVNEELAPFVPAWSGDGSVTLRRDFFDHDLHLSAAAGGRLIGERSDPDGFVYPLTVAGNLTLTGRIRALTLFWRIENASDLYIESDLRQADFPVPLPGLHNRIGATLRLVD